MRDSLERIGYFLCNLFLLLAAEGAGNAYIDVRHGLIVSDLLMKSRGAANFGEYLFEHLCGQTPGLGIVTAAMVAVI